MEQGSSFALRAILVADMVGYSRWLAHQPVATHAAFTHHLRDIFEPAVRAHAGVVIKTTESAPSFSKPAMQRTALGRFSPGLKDRPSASAPTSS